MSFAAMAPQNLQETMAVGKIPISAAAYLERFRLWVIVTIEPHASSVSFVVYETDGHQESAEFESDDIAIVNWIRSGILYSCVDCDLL